MTEKVGGPNAQPQPSGGKPPALTPGAAKYQQAAGKLLGQPGAAAELEKLHAGLSPADERSFREVAAYQMRRAAMQQLSDPSKRDDAQLVLSLLDRGELPAGPNMLIRVDTGEEVPMPQGGTGWKPR